ncbi:MAG: Fe-S protein assembly chaperone HscA [Acidiferrobacterales bacterium]
MALLQISEPGKSTSPHEHRLAIGIDLGTTNSLVASVRSGIADTMPDENGHHLLPSVVHYADKENSTVGNDALQAAQTDPVNTISSVKRMMGRSFTEISSVVNRSSNKIVDTDTSVPRIETAAGTKSAIEISSDILKSLRDRAEKTLGGELFGAVITVPAYFDDAQRQATKDAARLAGLKTLRLINEPTAAAVAYGLDKQANGTFVIYDLGGGTMDVSILRLNKGIFEVLATAGDAALGGDDMDHVIVDYLMAECGEKNTDDPVFKRNALMQARSAKEKLLTNEITDIKLLLTSGNEWEGQLTREKMQALVAPIVEKSLKSCKRAMRDARIKKSDIDGIVMVGGPTRMQIVRNLVSEFFGQTPLTDIDPDKVVAVGAALQADMLAGNKNNDVLLLDVTPLSLGLEIMGGLVEKIIPRNSTIPVARAQEFTTFKDGQTAMSIHVVQGEREMVADCRSLAKFDLKGIPPLVAGAARIRVTFQVDADGLLNVSATELTSGIETRVEVIPSYGLTDGEIESMLKDSISHAGDDMAARALREQQVEADRLHEAVTAALVRDGEALLDKNTLSEIKDCLNMLGEVSKKTDRNAIKKAIEKLDKATQDFAAKRMDLGVSRALSGHNINEFTKEPD